MSMNDTLAAGLSKILNAEKRNKPECVISVVSNLLKNVLDIMNKEGYIGTYEDINPREIKINILGRINKCGSIKPRFSVTLEEYDKFEKRYLLAKEMGILIISTSQGLMTHKEAKEKKLGGKLIAYCY